MIPNIDRRMKKIESQLHLDDYDFSQWSDAELEEHIIRELERMISVVGNLEAVAEAYRAEGRPAEAEMILRDYSYDPTSKTVIRKGDRTLENGNEDAQAAHQRAAEDRL